MTDRLALAPMPPAAPAVTADELDLVRRTIAKDATPEELKLYLFDCNRQGVHPLDKLIHFTKRSNKYTPVTSIDFLRIRAADSGECAGIDEPVFSGTPKSPGFAATVTVWRLVQGSRYAFTATARWAEYKPDQGFMWDRMPHTMLGKCAEALALRKGFPKQLAGLYVKEEMAQADNVPAVLGKMPRLDPPASASRTPVQDVPKQAPAGAGDVEPVAASADLLTRSFEAATRPAADMNQPVPDAWKPFVRTEAITTTITGGKRSKSTGRYTFSLTGGAECWTNDYDVAKAGKAYKENQTPVTITLMDSGEIVTLAEATDAAF